MWHGNPNLSPRFRKSTQDDLDNVRRSLALWIEVWGEQHPFVKRKREWVERFEADFRAGKAVSVY